MKRSVLLFAVVVCSLLLLANMTPAFSTSTNLTPDDTYVDAGNPTTNYGLSTNLFAGVVSGDSRETWLKFDISGIPNNVTIYEATIYMKCTYQDSSPSVEVHHCSDDSWTETGLTWNNKPSYNATAIDTVTASVGWLSWNVLSTVQAEYNDGNSTVSFVFKADAGYAQFRSVEYGSNIPYLTIGYYAYQFTFYGLYDEQTGLKVGAVNVTAYFEGNLSDTFKVNGTYIYNTTEVPIFFRFELGEKDREYWLSENEDMATIYIFNGSFTTYNVQFLDLAGVLEEHPFITIKHLINGTMHTVEKRKVDAEKKFQANLVQGEKYTLVISNGDELTYTYGDLLFTDEVDVTLTLKGIEFPQEVILAYRYVRIYATRHSNFSSISIVYQDTKAHTNSVTIYIKYENGTVAYSTVQSSDSFNVTWTNAQFNLTYYVQTTINHLDYGTMQYNTLLPRAYSTTPPWSIPIGSITNMNVANLIPIGFIVGGVIVFSKINAPVGALVGCVFATLLFWLGWIVPPDANQYIGLLVAGYFFTILYGLAHSKRRITE